eukprot:TRINITY_DN5360_c0_g1_i1.p1 TRINITY_DN5360_c0_g1~~TRINITY_DN5360_c0_g1_i1.p1  ORF type:complete len:553 (+),score=67.65 TRINITY_DN5360_c0_g1_i1:135-1793(+)
MWRLCWLPLLVAGSVWGFNPCHDPADYRPHAQVSSSYACHEMVSVIERSNITAESCEEAVPGGAAGRTWKYYVQLTGSSCCSGPPGSICGRPFLPCAEPTDYDPSAQTTVLGSCSTAVGLLTQMDISSSTCSNGFQGHTTPTSYYVHTLGERCCRSGNGSEICGPRYQTCSDEADFLPDFQPVNGTSCGSIRSMLRMSGFGSHISCADSVLGVPVSTYINMLETSCCRAGSTVNHACGVAWSPCSNRADFTPSAEATMSGQSVGTCSGLVSTLNFHSFDSSMCDNTLATTGLSFRSYVQATESNCCGTGTPVHACGQPYIPCQSMSDFLPNREVVPGTTCQAILHSLTDARFTADRCDDIFAGGVPFSTYVKMSEQVCCGSPLSGRGTCGTSLNPCANPNSFDATAQIMGTMCTSAMAQMFDVPDILSVNCSTCMEPCMRGSKLTLKDMLPQVSSCCGGSSFVNVCQACGPQGATTAPTTLPPFTTPAPPAPPPPPPPVALTDDQDLQALRDEIAALRQDVQNTRSAAVPRQCLALSAVALACLIWAVAAGH